MPDLPHTTDRVTKSSPDDYDAEIRRDTVARVRFYGAHPERIPDRLEELDAEWDIERTLETNASILALGGVLLGFLDRRFLLLPVVAIGFLLQHVLQGSCPPLSHFRRHGRRTRSEIEAERYALKALRGDFAGTAQGEPLQRANRALDVVEV